MKKQEKSINAWLKWFQGYGVRRFLKHFLENVEGAKSTCRYCKQDIFVDVLIGGGVPDWSTADGDFGCSYSPETTEDGTGGHMPIKKEAQQ